MPTGEKESEASQAGQSLHRVPDLAEIMSAPSPHQVLGRLRELSPVIRLPDGLVAVTGYAEALEVMKSQSFASGPIGELYRQRLPEGAARDEMSLRINFLDPPDHTRVRRLAARAFTPKQVVAIRPWIDQAAQVLAGSIDSSTEFDLLGCFAHQLPSLVISELLGVPVQERDLLTALSDEVAPLLAPQPSQTEIQKALKAAEIMHARLRLLIDQSVDAGTGELLAVVAHAEQDGQHLVSAELLSLAATLYSAGHRTTRDGFINAMVRFLDEGGRLWDEVASRKWPLAEVTREMLRLDTPTIYVARVAQARGKLGGLEIQPGDVILVFLAAANRDPAVYKHPDSFDPGREGPGHLAFAAGPHHCLGAALATAEIEAMLGCALRRWPGLRAVDDVPRWRQIGPFRGVKRLMVSL